MPSSVLAAVLRRVGDSLRVERLELADPGPGDVLVRLGAGGLCHTDLEVMRGAIAMPLPMVLGHEAAGVVVGVYYASSTARCPWPTSMPPSPRSSGVPWSGLWFGSRDPKGAAWLSRRG